MFPTTPASLFSILCLLFCTQFVNCDEGQSSQWDNFVNQRFGDRKVPEHWNWKPTFGGKGNRNQLSHTLVLQPDDGMDLSPTVLEINSVINTEDDEKSREGMLEQTFYNLASSLVSNPNVPLIDSPHIEIPRLDTQNLMVTQNDDATQQPVSDDIKMQSSNDDSKTKLSTSDDPTEKPIVSTIQQTALPVALPVTSTTQQPPQPTTEYIVAKATSTLGSKPYRLLPDSDVVVSNEQPSYQVAVGNIPTIQLPGSGIIIARPDSWTPTTTTTTVAPSTTTEIVSNEQLSYQVAVGNIPTVQLPGSGIIIARPDSWTTTTLAPPTTTTTEIVSNEQPNVQVALGNIPTVVLPGSGIIIARPDSWTTTTLTPPITTTTEIASNEQPSVQVAVGNIPTVLLPDSGIIIARPDPPTAATTVSPTTSPTVAPKTPTTTVTTVAPRTTTPVAPTVTSTTPKSVPYKNNVDGECNKCVYRNGVGFLPHGSDCTKFYKCQQLSNGGFRAAELQCPFGLYWNNDILSCDYPRNTKCTNHPCRNTSTRYVEMSGHCAGYWRCDRATPVGYCCPPGYRYKQSSQLCEVDRTGTCRDDCTGPRQQPSSIVKKLCDKRPVSNSKTVFEQRVPGNRWVKLDCAPSTAFNSQTCSCSDRVTAPVTQKTSNKGCDPMLHISFNNGVRDVSRHRYWLENVGVTSKSGTGIFNGNNKILVNRFANAPLGKDLVIEVVYEPTERRREEVLVSNGDCGVKPSLYISTGPNGVTFSVQTTQSPRPAVLTVPFSSTGGLTKARLSLKNGRLTGEVDGLTQSTSISGSVEIRKSSLIIGSGDGMKKFDGIMDDVKMFFCQNEGK